MILRGLLDQGLNADNMTLVTIGLSLAVPLLVWSLGSVRDAFVGVFGVVLLGLLWTRGSIGVVEWLGFDLRERVFLVLAYANCLVQGVSFVLHKFESFRSARQESPRADLRAHWVAATDNDPMIVSTAAIAILGFATLGTFQVLSIRELGLFSALAVSYQLVLTMVGIPALHLLTSRNVGQVDEPKQKGRWASRFAGVVDGIAARCAGWATSSRPARQAWIVGSLVVLLAVVALFLAWPMGFLLSKTYALRLVSGTVVERTGRYLNEPGRPGYDYYEFLIEPATGQDGEKADLYDPAFLEAASRFKDDLRHEVTQVREVATVLNQVARVSNESFGKPLPTTRAEASGSFLLVETNLEPAVARTLFYSGGVRISASFASDDTRLIEAIGEEALRMARQRYPELEVRPFGTAALNCQMDEYVRRGKPLNLLTSQWVVILACGLGLWAHNRRLRRSFGSVTMLSPAWGGVVMSIPFLFASAVMALVMIALEVPLDAGTAAITALAINASVDFSIYCADSYQEGLAKTGGHREAIFHSSKNKGRVVIEDVLLNSICFIPLVASRFEPIKDVGWIMFVMLFTCGFGALVLMPTLFYACIRPATAEASVQSVEVVNDQSGDGGVPNLLTLQEPADVPADEKRE